MIKLRYIENGTRTEKDFTLPFSFKVGEIYYNIDENYNQRSLLSSNNFSYIQINKKTEFELLNYFEYMDLQIIDNSEFEANLKQSILNVKL
jgi:hypothetical protein